MSSKQDDVSAPGASFSTCSTSTFVMHPLNPFQRHGLMPPVDPRFLDLRRMYQPEPVLQAPYFNYAENPSAFMVPPLVPLVPSLPTLPVVEEEKIDVGVEGTGPNRLVVPNTTPENGQLQLELSLRINQQLQEYHAQLLRLHEDLLQRAQEHNNRQRLLYENAPPVYTGPSVENTLPAVIDKNIPYYTYLQQALVEQQRSAVCGDQMTNVNRNIQVKSDYQMQEKGLQTDLPEQSQYNINHYKNAPGIFQAQLNQGSPSKPIDLVTYNIQPRQLAAERYTFDVSNEPLNLALPKKIDMSEWGLTPAPAHTNSASSEQVTNPGTYL